MKTVRMNLNVDEGVPELLTVLAEGERKRGQYLSNLIRSLHEGNANVEYANDVESLRFQLAGMVGKLKEHEGRLLQLEQEIAE